MLAASAVSAQTTRHVAPDGLGSDAANNCAVSSQPCATISHAIGQSGSGDTIQLQSGVYTESFSLSHSLEIRGAGMNATIVQAHPTYGVATNRVLSIPGVSIQASLRDLTIRHGRVAEGNGGGIANSGNLSLSNVRVSLNQVDGVAPVSGPPSSGLGGAIYGAPGSQLFMVDSEIANNESGIAGGGLYLIGNAEITASVLSGNLAFAGGGLASVPLLHGQSNQVSCTSCVFSANQAENGAGLIHAGGALNLFGSEFIGNQIIAADGTGGGIYSAEAGMLHAQDVQFIGNGGGDTGGALSVVTSSQSALHVSQASFTDNFTAGDGGAIHLVTLSGPEPPTLELHDVSFTGNTAGRHGGAIHNERSAISIDGSCHFEGNLAGSDGGAVFNGSLFPGSTTSDFSVLNSCDWIANQAGARGGALFNQLGTADLQGGTFDDNSSHEHGGAVYNQADLQMTGVSLNGNQTGVDGDGGAIFNAEDGELSMHHSTVSGNKAYRGGGIRNSGTLVFHHGLIANNQALTTSGGGLLNWDGAPVLEMTNSIIRDNAAATRGGGLFNQGVANLTRVALLDNSAQFGGGIHHSGGTLTVLGGAVNSNNALSHGGGIRVQAGGLQVLHSMIAGNSAAGSGDGIQSDTGNLTLAINNWWGSSTGPHEPGLNPGGQGNGIVGDNVSYSVWLEGLYLDAVDTGPATGTQAQVSAELRNSSFGNGASPELSARFDRTGANPGSGQAPFSGPLTQASLSWLGLNPGVDQVIAEVLFVDLPSGLVSQPLPINWSGDPIPDQIFLDRFE